MMDQGISERPLHVKERTRLNATMKNIRAVLSGLWMVKRKSPAQPEDEQARISVNFERLIASFRGDSDIRQ